MGWAVSQLRREHATVQGLARQLGVDWKMLWRSIKPRLVKLAADGTEAISRIIEPHRRLARGYRNPTNYRLRMLLAAGGLNT